MSKLISYVLGLVMVTAISSTSNASEHIKVTHEFFIPSEALGEVQAMTQAHDGGYVLAGSYGMASAVRIDENGRIQWKYLSQYTHSAFYAVAMLPDDSSILCGEAKVKQQDGTIWMYGLLTHIDKHGKVLGEQLMFPKDGNTYGLTKLKRCMASQDGVVVLGDTITSPIERSSMKRIHAGWIFYLNNSTDIVWGKNRLKLVAIQVNQLS